MAAIVNSDGDNGLVLTVDAAPAAPVAVETVALSENFNDIDDPAQSDAIISDGGWDVRNDQLFTNGSNDGTVLFAPAETEGPARIRREIKAHNVGNVENKDKYANGLTLQVKVDGGE